MRFSLLHPRDQLVAIMERIYRQGMITLSGGNLSVLDRNGDIWITPAGVDKGALVPRDIMCVRADGTEEGPHRPSSEYPFHRAIYARRPDLQAVVHAHPPALVSFSIARQTPDTRIIPQANRICGAVGYAPYALPGSEQLGTNIAATFAQGYDVVLLENHGIATGGTSLLEAFQFQLPGAYGNVPYDHRHRRTAFHSRRSRSARCKNSQSETKARDQRVVILKQWAHCTGRSAGSPLISNPSRVYSNEIGPS